MVYMIKENVSHYNSLSGWTRIINRRWFLKAVAGCPSAIIHATEKLAKSASSPSKQSYKLFVCAQEGIGDENPPKSS